MSPNAQVWAPMHTTITFEQGAYGCRAVLHGPWFDDLRDALLRNQVIELELNQGKGWGGEHVEFLRQMGHLRALSILNLSVKDVSAIHNLHELMELNITTYCKTKIDFQNFPRLEKCSLEWRPGSESIFQCKTLKYLFLNRYNVAESAPFFTAIDIGIFSDIEFSDQNPGRAG